MKRNGIKNPSKKKAVNYEGPAVTGRPERGANRESHIKEKDRGDV